LLTACFEQTALTIRSWTNKTFNKNSQRKTTKKANPGKFNKEQLSRKNKE